MHPKVKRIVNRKLLAKRRLEPCVACGRIAGQPGSGRKANEAEHISTKGSGGDDTEDNVWTLCFKCHVKKGMGFEKFLKENPSCVEWLEKHNRTDVFERLERK